MPTASNSQRDLMNKWFGDEIDDRGPTKFLLARGWTERGGMWTKPVSAHNPSDYEVQCLLFLHDEWDHDFHTPLFYSVSKE